MTGCSGGDTGDGALPESEAPEAQPLEAPGSESAAVTETPLAGTTWRLVEFQSMDDAQGTRRPADPNAFTMTLGADGTVAMRLDCNRATGSWTAEPASDPMSGTFEFGTLGVTRALCPPPNLDEFIAAQAPYVRGYLIRDGQLALSLMADGGIFLWEPHGGDAEGGEEEVPFSTEPDPALEDAILEIFPDYTGEGELPQGRYLHSRLDLNGDGREEAFVYMLGGWFCGTGGCNLLLFGQDSGGGYILINNFPITQEPVLVAGSTTQGWRDLIRTEAGGGAPVTYVRHTFDGTTYQKAERIPGEMKPRGTRVLAGELTFQAGIPLHRYR